MGKTFINDQCILIYGSKLTSKEKVELKNHLSETLALPKNEIVLIQRGKAVLVRATNAQTLITCPDCDGIPGPIPGQPIGGGGLPRYPDFILRSQTLNIGGIAISSFNTYFG